MGRLAVSVEEIRESGGFFYNSSVIAELSVLGEEGKNITKNSIMIVDSSAEDVALLRRALELARIESPVVVFDDGRKALEYLAGKSPLPCILLVDMNVQVVKIFEILEWLRSRPGLKDILVGILTGERSLDGVRKCYNMGAHTYLAKPVNPVEVSNLMSFFHGTWVKNHPMEQCD
jgi:CheY-like chemotaxis protein